MPRNRSLGAIQIADLYLGHWRRYGLNSSFTRQSSPRFRKIVNQSMLVNNLGESVRVLMAILYKSSRLLSSARNENAGLLYRRWHEGVALVLTKIHISAGIRAAPGPSST